MKHFILVGVSLGTLLFAWTARSRAQDDEEPAEEPLLVRIYEVSDIVIPPPNYPYRGTYLPTLSTAPPAHIVGGSFGFPNHGGGMFQIADRGPFGVSGQTTRESLAKGLDMKSLIAAIQKLIDPTNWDQAGGAGAIVGLGGNLAILQTESAHARIAEMLDSLRPKPKDQKKFTTTAEWLLLSREELTKVKCEDAIRVMGRGGVLLDPRALAELPRESRQYQCEITCLNNQTVHLVSGEVESSVLTAIPVVGTGTSLGHQPVIIAPHVGVLLELTPAALPDQEAVLFDVRSTITSQGVAEPERAVTNSQGTSIVPLDRLKIATQQFATTLTIPLGRPVLVGGVSLPASDKAKPVAAGADKGLYLVVTVSADE